MSGPHHLVFVYGTLKRDARNHAQLAGQRFVAPAQTIPGYALYRLDGCPGLVPDPAATEGILGELWSVDTPALRRLDDFEGVNEGLYRRERIQLAPPHAECPVEVYVFAGSIAGRERLGRHWDPAW